MATDLGKVGIVMKGTWSNSATYEVLDAVSYSGATYIAKQNVPANTLPTNTTYWQVGYAIDENAVAVKKSYQIPANSSLNVTSSRNCIFSTVSYTACYFGFGFVNGWITSVGTPIVNGNSTWTITGGVNSNTFTITNNSSLDRDMSVILL